jgi:hypothetical protein
MDRKQNSPANSNITAPSSPQKQQDLTAQLRQAVWWLGIPAWLFGLADRTVAALANGQLAWDESLTLAAIAFLFLSWLSMRPQTSETAATNLMTVGQPDSPFDFQPADVHLAATEQRMAELHPYHLISQSHILPFPYLAQIYHLLNLKHLETIHSFSLNNLRVLKVSSLEQTDRGGVVKFQTRLDSPWNVLRIWRQTIAEVQLTLLTPYTVELAIPVYGDKVIIVMFNTLPLDHTKHQFCVDIYSNLQWYKPLIKALLHFSTVLTLLEDLPYLEALTQKVQRLTHSDKPAPEGANHDMMWLFNRFVGLYGTNYSAPSWASLKSGV